MGREWAPPTAIAPNILVVIFRALPMLSAHLNIKMLPLSLALINHTLKRLFRRRPGVGFLFPFLRENPMKEKIYCKLLQA